MPVVLCVKAGAAEFVYLRKLPLSSTLFRLVWFSALLNPKIWLKVGRLKCSVNAKLLINHVVYHTVGAPGNHNYLKNNCLPVLAGPWQAPGHWWITWAQRTHFGPFAAKSAILRGQHHHLRDAPVASQFSAISCLLSDLTSFLTDGKKAVFIWYSRRKRDETS